MQCLNAELKINEVVKRSDNVCCMVFEKLCRGNRQAREHGHGVGRNLCRDNRGARKHVVGRRRLNRRYSRGGRTGNFRQCGAQLVFLCRGTRPVVGSDGRLIPMATHLHYMSDLEALIV